MPDASQTLLLICRTDTFSQLLWRKAQNMAHWNMADMQAFRPLTIDACVHTISSLRRGISSARSRLNNTVGQAEKNEE